MTNKAQKCILIIAHETDVHARAVAREVELIGHTSIIFDTAEFPKLAQLSNRFSDGKSCACIIKSNGTKIDLNEIHSVWWRRPQRYVLNSQSKHPSVKRFMYDECVQAFKGTMISLHPTVKFLNPIIKGEEASFKLHQLRLAKELGFNIPNTIVTNSVEEAMQFISNNSNDCIYKPFNGVDFGPWETRPLYKEDITELHKIEYCPFILQQHIHGDFDVRVTIVGNEIFSAKLLYKQGQHPVDSRSDTVPVYEHHLGNDIKTKLLTLVQRLGLFYGAVDLRYSDSLGYTFFEINPEGQYLWIEIETGFPISNSIAKFLCD